MVKRTDEISHEGRIVSDGLNEFLIKDGRRIWLSPPAEDHRRELLIQAERLRLSQSIRQSLPPVP
jgi:hypothetical protein